MIRINLLGRTRPKAVRQAVPLEATLQVVFLIVALAFSGGLLAIHYWQMDKEDKQVLARIQRQKGERPASNSSSSRWIILKSKRLSSSKEFR